MAYDNEPGDMNNPDPNTGGNPWTLFHGTDATGPPGISPTGRFGSNTDYTGGGGGGPHSTNPNAYGVPIGAPGSFGPDITLGPDGNVYGYARQYDSATNSYTYVYKNLGAATDLATVSAASGIPVGMIQSAVMQQRVTLNNLAAEGEINPYVSGNMTQQQLTQALDKVRTAQQYQSALAMQGIAANGMTYAQMQDAYNQSSAAFNYATQPLAQAAQSYGWQRANDQGANYNAPSGINGWTWGQLGLQNDNSQAMQQYAYGQNYGAVNPYTGLSNGQTGLQASNVQNAYNLTQGQYNISHQAADNQLRDLNRTYDTAAQQYNLGTADYTNGQTRQQYLQGTQDTQNQYNRADITYRLAHQGNQQALDTYNEATRGLQAQNNQSRNLTGLGWAGIVKPQIAGWT